MSPWWIKWTRNYWYHTLGQRWEIGRRTSNQERTINLNQSISIRLRTHTNCSHSKKKIIQLNLCNVKQWHDTNSPSSICVGVECNVTAVTTADRQIFDSPFLFARLNAISVHNEMHIIDNNNCSSINQLTSKHTH